MTFVIILITGIIATAVMSLCMWLVTRSGIANCDMIRAIGSLITGTYEDSFTPGMIVHFVTGTLIAFVYLILISIFEPISLTHYVITGIAIGLFHGVAFGFLLVAAVAEHHPLEMFRTAGIEVAAGHAAGHIIYGFVVGLVAGMLGISLVLF